MGFRDILFFLFVSINLKAQCVIDYNIIAIENIKVIPMIDTLTVWNNKTVIIQNNTISQIGNYNSTTIPPGAYVIDGMGKFLVPGLSDMHAHLLNRNDAILNLANGVTTVSNMHGEPWHITFRDSINNGQKILFSNKITSPRIYSTGPIMNYMGHPFFNPVPIQNQTQAISSLQSQDAIGYDFYKTYTYLTNGVFNAIQSYATTSGKFIRGHGNDWLGAINIINSNQKSIEHFWGYLPNGVYDSEAEVLENSTLINGKWNCPTLIVRWNKENINSIRNNEPLYVRYVCPSSLLNNWRNTTANPQEFSNLVEYKKLLKRLYLNNGKLMLGSDNITPYSVSGFSIHRELELCVEAGLSPHQALTLATSKPHEFLQECGFGNNAGTITVGKRADLIILNQNPLVNISNTQSIYGVIGNGLYYSAICLQSLLSNIACSSSLNNSDVHLEENTLEVFPNPVQKTLNIKGLPNNVKGEMLIINNLGQIILKTTFISEISIESLPCGLYYILAYDGHSYFSQKFIKTDN